MFESEYSEVIAEITPKDTIHFIENKPKANTTKSTWTGMIIIKNPRKFKLLYKIRTNNPKNYYIEDSYKLLEKYHTYKALINYIGPVPESDNSNDRIKVNYNELKDYKKTSEDLLLKDNIRNEWNANKAWYENSKYSREFYCQFLFVGGSNENHFVNKGGSKKQTLCINNISLEDQTKCQARVTIPLFLEGSLHEKNLKKAGLTGDDLKARNKIYGHEETNFKKFMSYTDSQVDQFEKFSPIYQQQYNNQPKGKNIHFYDDDKMTAMDTTLITVSQNGDVEKMRDENNNDIDVKASEILMQNKSFAQGNSLKYNPQLAQTSYGTNVKSGLMHMNSLSNFTMQDLDNPDSSNLNYAQRMKQIKEYFPKHDSQNHIETSLDSAIVIDNDSDVYIGQNYSPSDQFVNVDNYFETRRKKVLEEEAKYAGSQFKYGQMNTKNNKNNLLSEQTFKKLGYKYGQASSNRLIMDNEMQSYGQHNQRFETNLHLNGQNTSNIDPEKLTRQMGIKDNHLKLLQHEVEQLKKDLAREIFILRNIRVESKNKVAKEEIMNNKSKSFWNEHNGQIIITIIGFILGMIIAH